MKGIVTSVMALALVGYLGCGANADTGAGSMGAGNTSMGAGNTESASSMGSGMVVQGNERIAIMGAAHYDDLAGDADAYASLFAVGVEYGYMVCDQFELAARGMIALAQAEYSGTTYRLQDYSLEVVPKWRIPVEGNISPYIGPKAGLTYATIHGTSIGGAGANQTVFDWGAVAGIDIFLSKHSAIFVEYDYTQFKLGAHDLGGGSVRIRDQGINGGLAYWW